MTTNRLRIAGVIHNSVVNGIGIRDTLFLQGCRHHCKGCHNAHTWDETEGDVYTLDQIEEMFKDSENDITISGGEPLLQLAELVHLLKRIHSNQNKRFWLYTGYCYDEIPWYIWWTLSLYVDVVVDGRFEIDKKDLKLQFRGSSNQRLIDLPESVRQHKVILWEDKE